MLIETFTDYLFIYCYANDETIKERLEQRLKNKVSISDGRWEIYLEQKKNFQGLIIPEDKILKINTSEEDYFEKVLDKLIRNFNSSME